MFNFSAGSGQQHWNTLIKNYVIRGSLQEKLNGDFLYLKQ